MKNIVCIAREEIDVSLWPPGIRLAVSVAFRNVMEQDGFKGFGVGAVNFFTVVVIFGGITTRESNVTKSTG